MSAIGYARISELDQSNNSLDNQSTRITEYCHINNIQLEKIFTDNGKSAFTFDRPEWIKLEKYLRSNKHIRYLIVYHIDRFSRANLMDALVKLNEIEVKLKVKVLAVTDPVDLNTKDFSVQLLRSINLLFSNNERNRIQERVKDGIYRSLANGRFCNAAPLGYKNSRQSDGRPLLVVDPDKAPIIKKVFNLYLSGMGLYEIGREVAKDGFKQTGNSAVKRILSNPLYAGLIHLPAYKGQPPMEINALHAPLITKQAYYDIQSKLNKKTVAMQNKEEVWLRGVLHCHCGRKMTAGNSKGKNKYYWYYRCPVHRVDISAIKLHQKFYELLSYLSFSQKEVDFLKVGIVRAIELTNSKKGGLIMRNKLELEKVRKKIAGSQERYLLDPSIDPAVFAKVMSELKADECRLVAELDRGKTDTDQMMNILNQLLPKMHDIKSVFELWTLHQQQLFINTTFCNSLYCTDGIYRTPKLHPMFASKALILKEKGLLEIEQSPNFLTDIPSSTQDGSHIEHFEPYLSVFVA